MHDNLVTTLQYTIFWSTSKEHVIFLSPHEDPMSGTGPGKAVFILFRSLPCLTHLFKAMISFDFFQSAPCFYPFKIMSCRYIFKIMTCIDLFNTKTCPMKRAMSWFQEHIISWSIQTNLMSWSIQEHDISWFIPKHTMPWYIQDHVVSWFLESCLSRPGFYKSMRCINLRVCLCWPI
jgi:hypothetical protein